MRIRIVTALAVGHNYPMNTGTHPSGKVASLHLHPKVAGTPLTTVDSIELVENAGIRGEPRYFGKKSSSTGKPSRRQVTLIERAVLAAHANTLRLPGIAPGVARSNIETEGVDLVPWLGQLVRVGEAVVRFYEPRTPCEKMDQIAPGLRHLMGNSCQGVLAEVVVSGRVQVGDTIQLADQSETKAT